ncbi:hypothetical protein [Cellulosimicrobium sp. CUA-896]|uniref:hypothetical protein n=1 Tax=Cellulosimicrobium sp. CUA-896 TaxID=1517881 RepID=UPI0011153E48|nr:hypothetical protein [Cellulosimicrobium sp. CUA-896]
MLATLAVVAVILLAVWWSDASPPRTWIFWVEASLLLFFTIFWVLQSMEYWNHGIPDDAAAGAGPAPRRRP